MNDKIKPIPPNFFCCNNNFPILTQSFDQATIWEMIQQLGGKTDEIIYFINNLIEQKIIEYIDKRFNDIMIDAMYEEETETLILYLKKEEN